MINPRNSSIVKSTLQVEPRSTLGQCWLFRIWHDSVLNCKLWSKATTPGCEQPRPFFDTGFGAICVGGRLRYWQHDDNGKAWMMKVACMELWMAANVCVYGVMLSCYVVCMCSCMCSKENSLDDMCSIFLFANEQLAWAMHECDERRILHHRRMIYSHEPGTPVADIFDGSDTVSSGSSNSWQVESSEGSDISTVSVSHAWVRREMPSTKSVIAWLLNIAAVDITAVGVEVCTRKYIVSRLRNYRICKIVGLMLF